MLKKEGEAYLQVQDAFALMLANLDPDCKNFLNSGGMDVAQYVSELFAYELVAVGQAAAGYSAFTNTGGTDVPEGYAAMVFNTNGAFFIGGLPVPWTVNAGKITGGTDKAKVFIILHELGHAIAANGFENDFGNTDAGKANDKMIEKECKKPLDRIK